MNLREHRGGRLGRRQQGDVRGDLRRGRITEAGAPGGELAAERLREPDRDSDRACASRRRRQRRPPSGSRGRPRSRESHLLVHLRQHRPGDRPRPPRSLGQHLVQLVARQPLVGALAHAGGELDDDLRRRPSSGPHSRGRHSRRRSSAVLAPGQRPADGRSRLLTPGFSTASSDTSRPLSVTAPLTFLSRLFGSSSKLNSPAGTPPICSSASRD